MTDDRAVVIDAADYDAVAAANPDADDILYIGGQPRPLYIEPEPRDCCWTLTFLDHQPGCAGPGTDWADTDGIDMTPLEVVPEPEAEPPARPAPILVVPRRLAEHPDPPPAAVPDDDGNLLIPSRGFTVIYGNQEATKSFQAMCMAVFVASQGGATAYIDWERTEYSMSERLEPVCGGAPGTFMYGNRPNIWNIPELLDWATSRQDRLVVLDSIGAGGGHTNDAAEYIAWHNVWAAPFTSADVPVVGIDHDIRSKSGKKDRAQFGGLGSAAKGNMADMIIEVVPNKRTTRLTTATLIKRKDSHRFRPDVPTDHQMATFYLRTDPHGALDWGWTPASGPAATDAEAPSPKTAEKIRNDITTTLTATVDGLSANSIAKEVHSRRANVLYVLNQMVEDGELIHHNDAYKLT